MYHESDSHNDVERILVAVIGKERSAITVTFITEGIS